MKQYSEEEKNEYQNWLKNEYKPIAGGEDPKLDPDPVPEQTPQKEENITLSKEEYQSLLTELTNVKSQLTSLATNITPKEEPDLDSGPADEEADFSGMTPKKFYEHVVQTVGQPLLNKIVYLETKIEVADAKAKYKDDWDTYADEIKKTAMANPTMSIDDAYHLVKGKKGNPTPIKKEEPKSEPKPPIGEKPGVTSAATKQAPKTLREAAQEAMKSLNLKEE